MKYTSIVKSWFQYFKPPINVFVRNHLSENLQKSHVLARSCQLPAIQVRVGRSALRIAQTLMSRDIQESEMEIGCPGLLPPSSQISTGGLRAVDQSASSGDQGFLLAAVHSSTELCLNQSKAFLPCDSGKMPKSVPPSEDVDSCAANNTSVGSDDTPNITVGSDPESSTNMGQAESISSNNEKDYSFSDSFSSEFRKSLSEKQGIIQQTYPTESVIQGTDSVNAEGDLPENKFSTDLAEISAEERVEFLSEFGSLGLVSLFDEKAHKEDATKHRKKANNRQSRKERTNKRKLTAMEQADLASAENTEEEGKQDLQFKKKPRKTRPNYFVALRVSNPEIHSALKIVQDTIITHSEMLKPALIPLGTLHLTLMVMYLDNDEQIEIAKSALENCQDGLCSILGPVSKKKMACAADKPMELQECLTEENLFVADHESVQRDSLTVTFSGLDHFRHEVLFAKVSWEEDVTILKSVAGVVRDAFASEGILPSDSREFQPHLTVMKLSRKPALRKKGIKKIPVESYCTFKEMEFGSQPVHQLHLCAMNHPKDRDGFYKILATVELKAKGEEAMDLHVVSGDTGNYIKMNSQTDKDPENERQVEGVVEFSNTVRESKSMQCPESEALEMMQDSAEVNIPDGETTLGN